MMDKRKTRLIISTLTYCILHVGLFTHGQTSFHGLNLTNGSNLTFKGYDVSPTDAGDIVFQKNNGEELTRIRSSYNGNTGLASILFSATPDVRSTFWFTGEGNLGVGGMQPITRLHISAPQGNISTAVLHSNGGQAWGHTLTLATDNPVGDDPKLLFSYRNRAKHWAMGGAKNSQNFYIREDGGDGFHGSGFGEARMTFQEGGNIGIGIENPNEKLAVNGNIRAKEIKVEAANWPDYVFKQDYELMPLKEVEQHILQYGHLPDIPKAEQIEKEGLSVSAMNKLMMKKIEELTLHLIEKDKRIVELELLNKRFEDFEQRLRVVETQRN